MDVFDQFLEARASNHDRHTRPAEWFETNAPLAPPARLIAFDAWVRRQLGSLLNWPADQAKKKRQIEQCRILVESMVLDLWRRGWMLDGAKLAGHITDALCAVAVAQAKGKVRDPYAYLRTSLNAYVGAKAEEISAEARRTGSGHVGGFAASVLAGYGLGRTGPSIPELVAQRKAEIADAKQAKTLRQQLTLARREKAACSDVADGQQTFL